MAKPYCFEASVKVKSPLLIKSSLCLFSPSGLPDLQTYKSTRPSPFISAKVAPVDQTPWQATPALSVMSSNCQLPLLRYSLFST